MCCFPKAAFLVLPKSEKFPSFLHNFGKYLLISQDENLFATTCVTIFMHTAKKTEDCFNFRKKFARIMCKRNVSTLFILIFYSIPYNDNAGTRFRERGKTWIITKTTTEKCRQKKYVCNLVPC